MKKIFFAFAICGLILTSCGNKTTDHQKDKHIHADGSVHEHESEETCNHEHDQNHKKNHKHDVNCDHDKPVQESFEVNSDSLINH